MSATAAGTDRNACADAAPSRPNGAGHESAGREPPDIDESKTTPPGEGPLPPNPGDFVEEIHSRIDLIEVWVGLLKSKDEKIKQRSAERLTDLNYKGTAALADEPQQIIFDLPRPKRD